MFKVILNNRNILFNVLGALAVKGGSALLSLFLMPAYMRYFDNQTVLGVWFTILNLFSWIFNFDLGIGNGLRNYLTEAFAKNDEIAAKKYISSAYIIMGLFTILMCIVVFIIVGYIDWNVVFNVSNDILSESTLFETVTIILIGIMLGFFLRLINNIFYALQRSMFVNFISLISSLILFVFLNTATPRDLETNIKMLALTNVFYSNFPLVLATIAVFWRYLSKLRPSFRYFDMNSAVNVFKLGNSFFILQIMSLVLTGVNEIFISLFVTPEKVVEFRVYNSLFMLVNMFFTLTLVPIWSAVTKAFTQGSISWLKKLYRVLFLFGILGIACEFVVIPFLQPIVDFWLKSQSIKINLGSALSMATLNGIVIWVSIHGTITNGVGAIRVQMVTFIVGIVIKIPLTIVLIKIIGNWNAVIIASALTLIPNCFVMPFWVRKLLKRMGDV